MRRVKTLSARMRSRVCQGQPLLVLPCHCHTESRRFVNDAYGLRESKARRRRFSPSLPGGRERLGIARLHHCENACTSVVEAAVAASMLNLRHLASLTITQLSLLAPRLTSGNLSLLLYPEHFVSPDCSGPRARVFLAHHVADVSAVPLGFGRAFSCEASRSFNRWARFLFASLTNIPASRNCLPAMPKTVCIVGV